MSRFACQGVGNTEQKLQIPGGMPGGDGYR